MPTARSLRDAITNALDFLVEAELLLYAGTVAFQETRVSWHGSRSVPFLGESAHPTCDQYLHWLSGSHYSALLCDGSLLQMTYRLTAGSISSHRLAYVPCPVLIDEQLLREGEPVRDVVQGYLETQPASVIVLRSPVRFDFDPVASSETHPAAHMTINGPDCRIACVAPMHPYRFLDFVFRQFYPALRASQADWFEAAAGRSIGGRVLADADARSPHLMWPTH